jgi:hypothetical protein
MKARTVTAPVGHFARDFLPRDPHPSEIEHGAA